MSQEKEEEEDSPVLKIVLIHWYQNLQITLKNAEELWLQWPETIQATQASTEQKKQKTKMGRKTTAWIFQETKEQNLIRENFDMAEKGQPKERNWISSNSSQNNAMTMSKQK